MKRTCQLDIRILKNSSEQGNFWQNDASSDYSEEIQNIFQENKHSHIMHKMYPTNISPTSTHVLQERNVCILFKIFERKILSF